jgi:hypothetical protein
MRYKQKVLLCGHNALLIVDESGCAEKTYSSAGVANL